MNHLKTSVNPSKSPAPSNNLNFNPISYPNKAKHPLTFILRASFAYSISFVFFFLLKSSSFLNNFIYFDVIFDYNNVKPLSDLFTRCLRCRRKIKTNILADIIALIFAIQSSRFSVIRATLSTKKKSYAIVCICDYPRIIIASCSVWVALPGVLQHHRRLWSNSFVVKSFALQTSWIVFCFL